MKLRGHVSNFYIHVSGIDLYIPTIGLIWNLIRSQSKKEIDYKDYVIFLIGNLYVGHLFELLAQLQERRGGQGAAANPVWQQFTATQHIKI
jgi:hypothetical protein